MRTFLLALSVPGFLTPARAADPKDPEIGFDYRGLVRDQMRLVAVGKVREAVEFLEDRSMPGGLDEKGREALPKRFAALFGAGGKFVGQEVVGYRRIGSRAYRFYAIVYFEKTVVTFSYLLVRTSEVGWRINNITVSDGIDDVEKVTPFVPLGPACD